MSKLYICGLSQEGELENLKTNLEPLYPYYDGLVWTHHFPKGETSQFLESIKKEGKIIYTDWVQRLDLSRNLYLFSGVMKTGSWFLNVDCSECLYPKFFEYWPSLRNFLETNNIDGCVLGGKRFLYRYNEFLTHIGNPHESIISTNRQLKIIDILQIQPFNNPDWYWKNVHLDNKGRDKNSFIFHFLKYYTFPCSNHCLMYCENSIEEYKRREILRQKFRLFLEQNDMIPLTIDKFKWLCQNRLDEMKKFINGEKICNDAYHYFILNKTDFNEKYDVHDIIKI